MSERAPQADRERRLRQAADSVAGRHHPPERPLAEHEPEQPAPAGTRRLEQQPLWVDLLVRRAMERGAFDNLPGTGKPIRGLGGTHDPHWWVKGLIEREQISGVAPPALALRKEDAELDELLDREATQEGVRRVVVDFNDRVVEARRQLLGGPPVVTATRDADREVARWQARRAERRRERLRRQRELAAAPPAEQAPSRGPNEPRWWRRRAKHPGAG